MKSIQQELVIYLVILELLVLLDVLEVRKGALQNVDVGVQTAADAF